MQYASCGLGPSVAASGTGISRCYSNQGTTSPADGIMDIYLLLHISDASGYDCWLQI